MTTTPSAKPLRVPGRLVSGPTDLSAAFPYGGNELGHARLITLDRKDRRSPSFRAEERGGDGFEALWLGEDWFASASLSQWTEDTVGAAGWPYASGTGSLPLTTYPQAGSVPPQLLTSRGIKLLFVPDYVVNGGDDDGDQNALAWILYRAVPALKEPIFFSGFQSAVLYLAWEGFPDDAGRVGQVGALGDLSL